MQIRTALVLVPAFAAAGFAQLPTSQTLPISAAPARIEAEATLLAVEDGNQLHAFSTYSRRWISQALTAPTTALASHDDHLVAVDGGTLLGFASRRSAFTSVALSSPAPTLLAPPPQTYVSAAIDGNRVHFFSAFTGTFATASFAGAPFASVDKLTALASDGNQTYAFGAHFGTLVPLGTAGVSEVVAAGYGGYASTPAAAHLFSATRNTWRSLAAGPLTHFRLPTSRAAMLILEDPTQFRFWSALNDAVQVVPRSGLEALTFTDHAAFVFDRTVATAFSSATGSLTTLPMPGPVQVLSTSSYYILVWDYANTLHAYSGVVGGFATLPITSLATRVRGHALSAVAYTTIGSNVDAIYSAFTNQWIRPALTFSGEVSLTHASAAFRGLAGALHGFSALHGSITSLPGFVPGIVYQSGGNFAAITGNRIDVFNAELPAWSTQIAAAPPALVEMDTAAALFVAGNDVYFYGTRDDRWTHLTLPAPASAYGRGDELAYIQSATQLIGLSGSGQTSSLSTTPESWRVHARGGRTALHVAGEPGAAAALLIGTLGANVALPGIGTLLVDPSMAALIPLPPLPAVGTQALAIDVPATAYFGGALLHAQAAILPPAGLPYLTNVHRSRIF